MKVASVTCANSFFGDSNYCIKSADELEKDTDLMILWGGEDISPAIYAQAPIATNSSGPRVPSPRDTDEMDCILKAVEMNIPIMGICRGAQLLCAYGGGELFQHVVGHAHGHHLVRTMDGLEFNVSSTHHQQMIPAEHHLMIAWSVDQGYGRVYNGTKYQNNYRELPEAEILYIPEFNAVAIQGHPEYLNRDHAFVKYTYKLLKEFFGL